jgi:hypothetical protein
VVNATSGKPFLLVVNKCAELFNNQDDYNFRSLTMSASTEAQQRCANRSPFQTLCHVVDILSHTESFMAIFLSTNSHMSRMAPSLALLDSARALPEQKSPNAVEEAMIKLGKQQPPYTELPFDVYQEVPIITENEQTLQGVCTVEFLARYSRPL